MAEQILVIDDDPLVITVLESLLERLGHQPILATNAQEALQAVDNHKTSLKIVIVDAHLNDITGQELEVLVTKKTTPKSIPVVVISAHSAEKLKLDFPNWDIKFHLKKPFNFEELFHTLKNAFDSCS